MKKIDTHNVNINLYEEMDPGDVKQLSAFAKQIKPEQQDRLSTM